MAKPWNYFPCYFEWAEPPIVTILIIKVYLYSQSILIQWSKLCWVAIPLFCLFSSSFILDHPRSRLILDLCGSTDFFFFRSQAWILPFLLGIVLLILCPLCSKERFGWEEEVWKLKFLSSGIHSIGFPQKVWLLQPPLFYVGVLIAFLLPQGLETMMWDLEGYSEVTDRLRSHKTTLCHPNLSVHLSLLLLCVHQASAALKSSSIYFAKGAGIEAGGC